MRGTWEESILGSVSGGAAAGGARPKSRGCGDHLKRKAGPRPSWGCATEGGPGRRQKVGPESKNQPQPAQTPRLGRSPALAPP